MRPRTCVCAGLIGLLAVLLGPSVAVRPGRTVPAKEKTGSELVTLDASAVADAIRAGHDDGRGAVPIEPKWHIYWKNPGERDAAGDPDHRSRGPGRRPDPVALTGRLPEPVGRPGYDEATLLVPVRIDRMIDRPVALTVEAEWLVCKEVCLFGSGRRRSSRARTRRSPRAHAKAFAAARARLPRDLAAVPGAQVRCSTPEGDEPPILTLIGPMGDATEATFVPDLTPGVEVGGGLPVAATVADGTFTFELPLDVDPTNALDGRLDVAGVVLLGDRPTDPSFQIRMPPNPPGTTANPMLRSGTPLSAPNRP